VVHAKFVVKDVIKELEEGFTLEKAANYLTFVEGSQREVIVSAKPTSITVPVTDMKFTANAIPYRAPKFSAGQSLTAIAAPESRGFYSISDIKSFASGAQGSLAAPTAGLRNGLVLTLLRASRSSESATGAENAFFSVAIQPANASQAAEMLDLISAPKLQGDTLVLTVPRSVAGVEKQMTRALLSKIEIVQKGSYKYEKKTPQWELYAADWTSQLTVPSWPNGNPPTGGTARWEVEFNGLPSSSPHRHQAPGPETLEKVTHVTRAALDL
jgi:hypothetical protein